MHDLEHYIEATPDFPEKGVLFRDISPLLAQKFPETIDAMIGLFSEKDLQDIDGFVGVDARGFIFAAAMAVRLEKNFFLIRKAGKLPPPSIEECYSLEYGEACIQMKPGQGRVVLVDDVLATGGTLKAACELCTKAGYSIQDIATLIDLKFLNDFEWNGLTVRSLIQYYE